MDLTQQILWHLQRLPARDQLRVLDFVESLAIPGDVPAALATDTPGDIPTGIATHSRSNLLTRSPDTAPTLGLSHAHDPAWESDRDDCL